MTELSLNMELAALVPDEVPQTDLIAEIARGNREAMHSIFVLHQRRVYSIALNFFGGDESKAEDITQQVFLKIFTKMSFRGDSDLTTWLYRTTVNACIDETRKTRRLFGFGEWFFGAEPEVKLALDDKIRSREISVEVQAVIGSLKPKYRLPLLLKYVEGLSYQEIARVLECSVGTISSRLNRGHKLLAAKLERLREEVKGF